MHMRSRRRRRPGFTLMEVMVVITILGVLCAIPMPMFARALEQSKLDVAAGNLRGIWAAERLYYLQNGAFTDLTTLTTEGLLDPSLTSGSTFYSYQVIVTTTNTLDDTITIWANHPQGSGVTGSISLDQNGNINSLVTYPDGTIITPSFEDKP